jgi:hypothetical protein
MDQNLNTEENTCKFGYDTCSNINDFCHECENGDNYESWESTPSWFKDKLKHLQDNFKTLDAKTQEANELCKSFEEKIRNLNK